MNSVTAPCIPKKNKSFVQPVPVVWMVRPAWPLCEQESDSTLSAAVAVAASPSKAKDGRREGGRRGLRHRCYLREGMSGREMANRISMS